MTKKAICRTLIPVSGARQKNITVRLDASTCNLRYKWYRADRLEIHTYESFLLFTAYVLTLAVPTILGIAGPKPELSHHNSKWLFSYR